MYACIVALKKGCQHKQQEIEKGRVKEKKKQKAWDMLGKSMA